MAAPIHILHQDRYLLFADKPARMLTVPAPKGKAENKGKPLLSHLLGEGHHVFAVHRLDYETSGVVLFAKDPEIREAMMTLFKEKAVSKSYEAVCQGQLRDRHGVLDFPIRDLGATACIHPDGEPARTRYEVLKDFGTCSLLRLHPETGRHNQIRLHLAHIGRPIVGERKFAIGRAAVHRHKRVLLHATCLKVKPSHLSHPLRIKSRLPEDFQNFLNEIESSKLQSKAKPPQGRKEQR
ncbi:MAG: RluA family pseudouridine synthase [Planctomycetota bacterium]|jgi:RluA family pseudouridine synthase